MSHGSFDYGGRRIAFSDVGDGEHPLVLTHGLLMNRRMYSRLGPEIAALGNRVISIDLLGHGDSDAPEDLGLYSMTAFAEQIEALLDHLGIARAVVGGTSLGANVALEFGVAHPERAQGLFVEMPVLENALVAVAVAFTPVLVGAQLGGPLLSVLAAGARRVPRRPLPARHRPRLGPGATPTARPRVLQGLLAGRTCPPRAEREGIEAPALIVGHRSDPVHPFSDSDDLARELANGRLIDANSRARVAPHAGAAQRRARPLPDRDVERRGAGPPRGRLAPRGRTSAANRNPASATLPRRWQAARRKRSACDRSACRRSGALPPEPASA